MNPMKFHLFNLCIVFLSFDQGKAFSPHNQILASQPKNVGLRMAEDPNTVSSKQALMEMAKDLDPSLAKGEDSGSYSETGWSNRVGTALTPVAIPDVYTGCRPFYWNKIDVGGRMTVIKLSDGGLFVHSPVCLDSPLKDALSSLGEVRHVVSPNYEHVKYAKMWSEEYPDACMWACPGMMEKEPQVRWTGEIPYGARPPNYTSSPASNSGKCVGKNGEEMWDWDEIQPLHIDCEVNPFTGKPFFNEVVFFHTPSQTLLTTDVYWNYPNKDGITNSNLQSYTARCEDFGAWELAPEVGKIPFGTRAWKFGMDQIYRPFFLNFMIKPEKQTDFKEITTFMSSGWNAATLVPCHGDIIRGKNLVKDVLNKHFQLED